MTLTIEARPRSPALDAAAVRRLAGTLAGWAARAAATWACAAGCTAAPHVSQKSVPG